MIAPTPANEAERLSDLHGHCLLDTPPENEYDDIARLAAFICDAPIAAVSFVDAHREWFKSIVGLAADELPREIAFCAHTILQNDLLVVEDTVDDPRFCDNPLVTGASKLRFYAGFPIITENGHAIGSLCVADSIPRTLTPKQTEGLQMLTRLAASQIKSTRRMAEREDLVVDKEKLLTERECLLDARQRAEIDLAQTHAALTESEERLRRLTDAAFEGVAVSQDGVLVDASPAFAKLLRYDAPSELMGLVTKDLPAPESRSLVAGKIDTCDEEPYEVVMLRRDGTRFHAELRGRMIQLGDRPARVTAMRDITVHKKMEQALREHAERIRASEAGLRAVLEGAPVILYATAADGTVTLSQGDGLRALGLQPGEAIGRSVFEFCDGQAALEENTRRALSGEPASYDIYLYGVSMHVELRPIFDHSGLPNGLIGVCYDVTERVRSEERFRVLFEHSSDAHLLFDGGGIIDCNPSAVALLRCSDKAHLLSLHPAVLSPELQPDGRRSDEKCIEMDACAVERGVHRFEWVHKKMDGEEFPVEVTLTPVTLEGRPVMLVVWHDLTERKQAEEALSASHKRLTVSETRLRLALESGSFGSYELDQTTFHYLEASDTYKAHFGLSPETEMSFGMLLSSIHPDDAIRVKEVVEDAVARGCGWQVEHRVIWPDGSIHWGKFHGLPIYNDAGKQVRMIGISQDITDWKAFEAEREHLAERERNIAVHLQTALQPPLPTHVPETQIAHITCPALEEAEIGGDFYDFFALDSERYALVVADVSGKGLAAAQQIALLRNSLRTTLYEGYAPAHAATVLNSIVTAHDLLVGFVTAFVAIYDTSQGTLVYCSCGHEPALIRRAGDTVEVLKTTGPPIGLVGDADYAEDTVTLKSGDSLMIYTDGLSEAGPNRP